MKDLPLPTFLPIMLETAEMTSDVEELGEEFDSACLNRKSSPLLNQSTRTPPSDRPCEASSNPVAAGHRRSSLPCDQSGGVIRRHFNQLKTKRKVSAPSTSHQPSFAAKSAAASLNPLAAMTGSPLIDLLEKLRPRNSNSSTDSGVESNAAPASISY